MTISVKKSMVKLQSCRLCCIKLRHNHALLYKVSLKVLILDSKVLFNFFLHSTKRCFNLELGKLLNSTSNITLYLIIFIHFNRLAISSVLTFLNYFFSRKYLKDLRIICMYEILRACPLPPPLKRIK